MRDDKEHARGVHVRDAFAQALLDCGDEDIARLAAKADAAARVCRECNETCARAKDEARRGLLVLVACLEKSWGPLWLTRELLVITRDVEGRIR